MKPLLAVVVACLVMGASIDAQANIVNGIDVLPGSYSASVGPGSSATSVDGSPLSVWGGEYTTDPYGGVLTKTIGYASVDMFDVSARAEILKSSWQQPSVWAHASGGWRFRPLHDSLLFNLDITYEQWVPFVWMAKVTLTDVTAMASLISIEAWPNLISSPQTYELVANHEYGLFIEARSWVVDIGTASMHITASIESVPEPGTMFLLGFCLMGVVGLRKKFLNN
jgi:hypothetical protein